METLYPILYMAATLAIVASSVLVVIMLVNSTSKMETKLEGMWVNESQTMRILIHQIDSEFQGKIVWVSSLQKDKLLGRNLFKDLVMKSFAQGCTGVYVAPETDKEFAFRLWFSGRGIIKMTLLSKEKGPDNILREEKWFRI